MMNDSVREELKDKISIAPKPVKFEVRPNPPAVSKPNPPMVNKINPPILTKPKPQPIPQPIPKPQVAVAVKPQTTEIAAKPTSPTLIEFQNKNATLPEWRLQLQNAVRKRVDSCHPPMSNSSMEAAAPVMSPRIHLPTSGSAALKAEVLEEAAPLAAKSTNPKLENALRRIEESRKRFLAGEEPPPAKIEKPKAQSATASSKNFPFYIATKNTEVMPKPPEMKTSVNFSTKPKIENPPLVERDDYDTNKLRPLPNSAIISSNLEKISEPEIEETKHAKAVKDAPFIKISRVKDGDQMDEREDAEFSATEEEIEDLAPFAMRFNAGLFDLIIGSFTALVLLAPFMLSGGNWFSIPGFLAFLVTCSIVMFIYLTTSIGLFGKTLGMKLFSLETIDIEENDYPTLHQAAVSSSVYLVSLALGGIGFLPALFNSERRTAPDLLSGTIIVKEY